ncbi:cytosolic sulfotransferase 15-like [Apium graveolens]|uniref:cytosolic sulfotransferase 15-like n=1 Tax=Apium graveolens TaxID=4045 RepID=UPI003D79EB13
MESKSSPPLHHNQAANNEEVEDMLSSFPKERGILAPYAYQYQGFWYYSKQLPGIFNFQKHFQPRKNDIFLATSPKSGTTWMKAILYALINREVYPPTSPQHPLLNETPHNLVPSIEFVNPSEYDSISNSPDSGTRIFATHTALVSLPKSVTDNATSNCKIVFLCRDIKDNFVSYFHYANKLNLRSSPISLEDAFNLYCKGITTGGPVWNQILAYWKESLENPHKVLFMKYDDVKNEPQVQLRRLAHFLGKPFSPDEENRYLVDQIISLCSFDHLSKLEVNNTGKNRQLMSNGAYFRKGVVGDWKNYLSEDMVSRLDQITEEKFHGSGISL